MLTYKVNKKSSEIHESKLTVQRWPNSDKKNHKNTVEYSHHNHFIPTCTSRNPSQDAAP